MHSNASLGEQLDTSYQPATNQWLEKEQAKNNRSKMIVIGSLLALVGLIAVGVVVGVLVSKHNKNNNDLSPGSNSGSGSGSGSNGSGSGSGPVTQTDPNDPSTFVKNPLLIKSFYGIAYTPEGAQLPECGATLADVITDIQLMSQLTTRIRLYGADCNQSALVLEAIKQTKVDMTVWLGNYCLATDNGTAYDRQRGEIQAAIQTYGTDHIGGITVGNEFMLDYLDDNDATDPNGPVGNTGAAILIADIKDTRNMLASMNLPTTLQVGTSDAGDYFNNLVLEACDYGMANVHPWFANVSAENGAAWTSTFFEQTDVAQAAALPNNPKMYIAETGWPTNSSDISNETNGPGNASIAGLQVFLDTFICQANANGTAYFFFEYFDEPWKTVQFGGVEGYWGLFTANRTLKSVTIPNCPLS